MVIASDPCLKYSLLHFFVCLFMWWVCTWPGAHVLVREQLVGVGPLLSPCGLRDPARASRLDGNLLPQGPSHKAQVTLVGWTPAAVSMLVCAPSLRKRIASRGPVFCLGW